MKLFKKMKDGGPLSRVTGFFLIEWKRLFSVVLLRFDPGTREAFHSHAFNSVSWVLGPGYLSELVYPSGNIQFKFPRLRPFVTKRNCIHMVKSSGTTWVLTFRGPWAKTWMEVNEKGEKVTLTHGRVEV